MQGTIVQVNCSPGGLPKLPVSGGLLTSVGLEGDRHAHPQFHGGVRKAVLLVAREHIEALRAAGYPLFPGALGENLTTEGLDYRRLPAGARLRAGAALLEITQPRTPCAQLWVYGEGLGDAIFNAEVKKLGAAAPLWGVSGLYAAVIEPGAVSPGDIIALVAEPA